MSCPGQIFGDGGPRSFGGKTRGGATGNGRRNNPSESNICSQHEREMSVSRFSPSADDKSPHPDYVAVVVVCFTNGELRLARVTVRGRALTRGLPQWRASWWKEVRKAINR
jgi:hypothetical protein